MWTCFGKMETEISGVALRLQARRSLAIGLSIALAQCRSATARRLTAGAAYPAVGSSSVPCASTDKDRMSRSRSIAAMTDTVSGFATPNETGF